MRSPLILLPLILFACDQPAPAPKPEQRAGPVAAQPASRAQAEDPAHDDSAAADAASALRRYYALIERGDYGGAWAMRTSHEGIDRERFEANFKAYESYRASVGAASRPVRSDDFDYVEIPVMITGRFVGGKPFGSSGSVTLRRARDGADRAWRIHTG